MSRQGVLFSPTGPCIPAEDPEPVEGLVEGVDAMERRCGGKWREGRALLPDEEIIVSHRLT